MDEDEESVRIAIAALGSLKTASNGNGSSSSRRDGGLRQHHLPRIGGELTLPPISTIFQEHGGNGQGSDGFISSIHKYDNGESRLGRSVHPSHQRYSAGGVGSAGPARNDSNHSPATTPSAVATSSSSSTADHDRPPYSTRFVRAGGEEDLYTPGTTISGDDSSVYFDGMASEDMQTEGDDGFIGRVSQFPLVSGALRVYERGRNSSRVVKYGTDLVESSVKTVSKPVLNRVIGPGLAGQLDGFACRQLDRFGSRPSVSPRDTPRAIEASLPSEQQLQQNQAITFSSSSSYFPPSEVYYRRPHGKGRAFPDNTEGTEQDDVSISPTSETPTLDSHYSATSSHNTASHPAHKQQLVMASTSPAGRSRWQNLVIEAGVTAGGIGAAVSEESMKSLKYCLHWLHYATAHLDHQAGILREFILSLSSSHLQRLNNGALARSEDARAASILDGIKREVVETIKKVVDVVSTYAGAALPEQAKRYVRSSILGLPEKWARAMQGHGSDQLVESEGSASGSQMGDGMAVDVTGVQHPRNGPTQAAAERTLTFAVESLDMLRGVLNIFNESVERADAWVERLRIVGLQRQQVLSAHQRQLGHQPRSGSLSVPTSARRRGSQGSLPSPYGDVSTGGLRRRQDAEDGMPQRRKSLRTSANDVDITSSGRGVPEEGAMDVDEH